MADSAELRRDEFWLFPRDPLKGMVGIEDTVLLLQASLNQPRS